MVRSTVTPNEANVSVHIPENYIGRKIEILLYPVDELIEEKPAKKLAKNLRGSLKLSDEEYKSFQQYATNIRNEWDRDM